ncbi:thioredoxin domain-containing protein [Parerythrobacter aestuarii]|uniref:thioredoxin domain-containing protein n=1 Tax=Parerythrobacter aestuarii TaxID=3020909 RepID=UPI0024DED095|nr:thioredoxin domain-containing protein [Parerythrobacter aestuarii]
MRLLRVWKTGLKAAALVGAGLALSGQNGANIAKIERTETSHIIGDPNAPVTLTEWVSYTCPACGNFARTGEPVVKIAYVDPGKAKFEIRYLQRNVVDVAVTLAAWCGGADKFALNHSLLMHQQGTWLAKAQQASKAQQDRWFSGAQAERRKAIASDIDLYSLMEGRGIGRAELNRCLSDDALADRLTAASSADTTSFELHGTPSFAIDGKLLKDVHGWSQVAPLLSAATAPQSSSYGPN